MEKDLNVIGIISMIDKYRNNKKMNQNIKLKDLEQLRIYITNLCLKKSKEYGYSVEQYSNLSREEAEKIKSTLSDEKVLRIIYTDEYDSYDYIASFSQCIEFGNKAKHSRGISVIFNGRLLKEALDDDTSNAREICAKLLSSLYHEM